MTNAERLEAISDRMEQVDDICIPLRRAYAAARKSGKDQFIADVIEELLIGLSDEYDELDKQYLILEEVSDI